MKSILFFCLSIFLLSSLYANDPDLPWVSQREIYVYVQETHVDWEESPVSLGKDAESMERIWILEDQHLYRLELPRNAATVRLAIGEKVGEWELPANGRPLFLGIPNIHLFPNEVAAWSENELENRRPLEVQIEGEMPLVDFSEVELLLPFMPGRSINIPVPPNSDRRRKEEGYTLPSRQCWQGEVLFF